MKVIVEYDSSTGAISDTLGTSLATWFDLHHFGEPPQQNLVRELIKLKEAGFSADELVKMKEGGLL